MSKHTITVAPSASKSNDACSLISTLQRRIPQVAAAIVFILFFSSLLHLPPTFPTFPFHPASQETLSAQPALPHGPTIHKNVAAIIESRPLDHLVPLLLHFSSVLGPSWPIILFTSSAIPISAPLRRAIDTGRISVKYLESKDQVADKEELLTRSWIWEQLAPAERVLFFDAESILCSASARNVEDFAEWDFVGTSGLSLRNREMSLDVVRRNRWGEERVGYESEDQWFQRKMRELPVKEDGEPAARFPSEGVARQFVVERVWGDYPLGFHGVERWQEGNLEKVDRWCPEWRIASRESLIDYKL